MSISGKYSKSYPESYYTSTKGTYLLIVNICWDCKNCASKSMDVKLCKEINFGLAGVGKECN
jgi:hypothetical protein